MSMSGDTFVPCMLAETVAGRPHGNACFGMEILMLAQRMLLR